jgi:hypothetical protein
MVYIGYCLSSLSYLDKPPSSHQQKSLPPCAEKLRKMENFIYHSTAEERKFKKIKFQTLIKVKLPLESNVGRA